MFNITIDKVCFVIQLAREFEVKVPAVDEDSGSNPIDDADIDVLEEHEDDPVEDEFTEFVDGLNSDEKYDLVALMWIGRGTYSSDQWEEARGVAADEATHKTSEYLLGTPLMSDYLEDALYQFGYDAEDIEKAMG